MNYFEKALPRYGEYTENFSNKKARGIIHQFVALDGKTYAVIEKDGNLFEIPIRHLRII
jgi:cation transport ATPase